MAEAEFQSVFRKRFFFDERAAGFYALGELMSNSRPVAIMTTSGTAVGELLPSVMEAHHAGLQLVLVTADRPRAYRGSGAPQTAHQAQIFGHFAKKTVDLEAGTQDDVQLDDLVLSQPSRPLHFNVCFDEPLEVGSAPRTHHQKAPSASLMPDEFGNKVRRPLVLLGALANRSQRQAVLQFLKVIQAPVYAEGLSGLRESSALEHLRIRNAERIFAHARACDYPIDGVIRLGGVPTLRAWRDLEQAQQDLPVISVSTQPWSGLGRSSSFLHARDDVQFQAHLRVLAQAWGRQAVQSEEVGELIDLVQPKGTPVSLASQRWRERDAELSRLMMETLAEFPQAEPAMIWVLSRAVEEGSRVFLGNSLPIRHWDLASTHRDRSLRLGASRGLNGIDGQISSFLGFAKEGVPNWAFVGDLTALYDLNAPWILPQLGENFEARLVIVNNGGGQIFAPLFKNPIMRNEHSWDFKHWAAGWNLEYVCFDEAISVDELAPCRGQAPRMKVIELKPNAIQTQRFWHIYRLHQSHVFGVI